MSRKLSPVQMLLGLIGLPAAALAADPLACEAGSRIYLEVVFHQRGAEFGTFPPPPNPAETRAAILICRDRRFLETEIFNRTEPSDPRPFLARVTKGRLTPLSWNELTSAAQAMRIGLMSSCRLQLQPILGLVDARVTWHGAGSRINTFQMSSFDNSLRACTLEEERLWLALAFRELAPGAEQIFVR